MKNQIGNCSFSLLVTSLNSSLLSHPQLCSRPALLSSSYLPISSLIIQVSPSSFPLRLIALLRKVSPGCSQTKHIRKTGTLTADLHLSLQFYLPVSSPAVQQTAIASLPFRSHRSSPKNFLHPTHCFIPEPTCIFWEPIGPL